MEVLRPHKPMKKIDMTCQCCNARLRIEQNDIDCFPRPAAENRKFYVICPECKRVVLVETEKIPDHIQTQIISAKIARGESVIFLCDPETGQGIFDFS